MSSPSNHQYHLGHLKIPLETILSATNNFADENVILIADLGNIYKGQFLWSGELINISAQRINKERKLAEQEFWMEIFMLSSLKHKNLISLVGFCDEKDEKVIIYINEPRGLLSQYLNKPMLLTWVRRLEICVGLAHALSYIHHDKLRNFSVIHRNIAGGTVQLNDDWEPKLSYFGGSMEIEASQRHHSFHTNLVLYTYGFGDPTYLETKSVNHKSDIYSFGILLCELLCGRESIISDDINSYLAPLVITHYREKNLNEIIDWDLWKQMDSQSFNIFTELAYDCLNEERSQRPNIDVIVPRLQKALELARENRPIISSLDDFAHLKIPLESILSATNNFDEENLIVTAHSGNIYKGRRFLWSGELININARRINKEWEQAEQQFWMDISMLSNLKHKNLISLVGFCDEKDDKVIITMNETRGWLYEYLDKPVLLTWVRRLEICVGLSHALSYIHHDKLRNFSVIHRNIASGTVELNDDWEPKLSYFGCSMKIEASQRHRSFRTDRVEYAYGHGDPTYLETKIVNHKSDIYSFGTILCELLCGRRSIVSYDINKYLPPLVITHYREKNLNEIIDWDLWKQMDSQSFNIFTKIAYDCLNEVRLQRPNIDEIVPRLQKALELARANRPIISSPGDFAHLKISLEDILSATNNFSEENCISSSRIAKKYKGQILWSDELIKIDAQRLNKKRDDEDEEEFWMELFMLSSLKHKNLVSIVGVCDENDEKIIIYRHEARGMLYPYLSDPMLLTWVRRLKICVGLAKALSYIHYDETRDFSLIHRRIDNTSVLLDDDWEPKLYDFQFSMKIKASQRHHSFHTNLLKCTDGFGDPTYIETNTVNHKSDMYSFGIILFELLCCRDSIIDNKDGNHLAPLAITHYREKKLNNITDPELWKQMDLQSFNMFAEIAYECLDEERSRRPTIDVIVPRLEKALELARENKPIHSSPDHLTHLRISLEDIESATNNFDEINGIGTSGFYKVYKGELVWSGELVNITAWRLFNKEWDEIEQQFWTEISMLSSLQHKNLVSIFGFCNEVGAETIIYKCPSRGRLEYFLSNPMLTWVKRLDISIGIARALSYIHYDEPRDFSVIHRNISSEAIQLNNDWEPKLSQFQHSMNIKASERHHTFHSDSVWSTKGYTDPTYVETGKVNHKSDIYSFGIVLFELLCGRKSVRDDQDNKYLTPVAIFHYREKILDGIIDPDLWKQMDPRSLNIFAETAYECLNEEQSQRPNIDQIVTRLEK
ncbi:kinase-like domain, phloem protein 2-like protein, partial [Tanacetum coccineum]